MAEILYVDWDGLIYYDGKVKDYIDDKIKECLKFRGNVSYEELLQTSPSVDTVNTAFRLSEEFVTNEWFNKPGFAYPEGTIVYVAQFEDGTYKFDILVEPNGSNSGTDLTNYYNKQEVDDIVSELPTKEFVEKTVIDAIDSVEIDVSGLVAREELELLETKEDAEAKLTAANKYTDDKISAIMGDGVDEAYNSFKELQELMKADDGVTQTLLNDVSELKIETKALEMSKANSQHTHSVNDIAGLPNYSELATKEELEAVQNVAGSNSVKLFAIESDLVDINQKLDNIETPDLSDYATKDELTSVEAKIPSIDGLATEEFVDNRIDNLVIPDVSGFATKEELEEAINNIEHPSVDLTGYATEEWVNTQGFLKEHQDLSEYATKDELFSKDYNELINTPEIPSVEGLASETWVNSQGFLTEHQSLEGYAKLTDIPDVSNFATKEDIPSIDGLATEEYVTKAIENAELSGKDVDLSNYYTRSEVDNLIPDTTNFATKGEIPDVSNLVSRETLSIELSKKANDVLFTEDYRVGTPIGLFVADDSVKDLTLSQIISRLLGLTLYVPPVVPGLPENVPESTPEEIKNIIVNKLPAYVVDGTGTIVEADYETYYKQMTTSESYADSTGNHFYQVVNAETGELEESGYQVDTIEDEELWMTVAIPNTVTKFHVEQYNSKATGDDKWQKVTYTLVAESDQPIEGYTVYSVDGMDGGVTIRIVIDD